LKVLVKSRMMGFLKNGILESGYFSAGYERAMTSVASCVMPGKAVACGVHLLFAAVTSWMCDAENLECRRPSARLKRGEIGRHD
jgi:hypothetical protein